MPEIPFARLAELSQKLEQTSKRLELAALLAEDKPAAEADTLQTLCQLYEQQFETKGPTD